MKYVNEALSSKRWVVDRATLKRSRAEDLQYADDPEQLDFLNIFFAQSQYMLHIQVYPSV